MMACRCSGRAPRTARLRAAKIPCLYLIIIDPSKVLCIPHHQARDLPLPVLPDPSRPRLYPFYLTSIPFTLSFPPPSHSSYVIANSVVVRLQLPSALSLSPSFAAEATYPSSPGRPGSDPTLPGRSRRCNLIPRPGVSLVKPRRTAALTEGTLRELAARQHVGRRSQLLCLSGELNTIEQEQGAHLATRHVGVRGHPRRADQSRGRGEGRRCA